MRHKKGPQSGDRRKKAIKKTVKKKVSKLAKRLSKKLSKKRSAEAAEQLQLVQSCVVALFLLKESWREKNKN